MRVARRSSDAGEGPPRRPRRTQHAEFGKAPPPASSGLGGLLRGPGSVLGGLSAVDGASRSLDRLSRAAERGADFLDRLDAEIGMERALELIDRLESVVELLEGIRDSAAEIEAMVGDLYDHLLPPQPRAGKQSPRARR